MLQTTNPFRRALAAGVSEKDMRDLALIITEVETKGVSAEMVQAQFRMGFRVHSVLTWREVSLITYLEWKIFSPFTLLNGGYNVKALQVEAQDFLSES